MDRLTREEIAGAVARGYCTTANMHKELDADLVTAITNEVMALFQSLSQEEMRDEAQIQAETLAQLLGAAILRLKALGETSWELPPYARALALKREPNAAEPELEVETKFRLVNSGPKYEFDIEGWPKSRMCSDPQECKRANRCLEVPPCGKFAAMTGASDD